MKYGNTLLKNIGKVLIACALGIGAVFIYLYLGSRYGISVSWIPTSYSAALFTVGAVAFVASMWLPSRAIRIGSYCAWVIAGLNLAHDVVMLPAEGNFIVSYANGITLFLLCVLALALTAMMRYANFEYALGGNDRLVILRMMMIVVFVWINNPFLTHPAVYSTFMISYITLLFMAGVYYNFELVRHYSYFFFGFFAIYIAQKYTLTRWVHPHYTVQIVYVLGLCFLALILIRSLFHVYRKRLSSFELTRIEPLLHLAIVFVVLALGRALIIISFDIVQVPGSFFMKQFGGYSNTDPILIRTIATDVYLRIYYAIFAALLCAIGFVKRQKGLICLSVLLVILVLHKIWCLLIGTRGIVDETVALVFISGIIILTTHIYRKYEF